MSIAALVSGRRRTGVSGKPYALARIGDAVALSVLRLLRRWNVEPGPKRNRRRGSPSCPWTS